MSERGESLDPVRMLNVASWRKLRASGGRVQRGLESQNLRPPNMRVQRTRVAPLRSPLNGLRFGDRNRQRGDQVGFPGADAWANRSFSVLFL
jgi:hypothetical protein